MGRLRRPAGSPTDLVRCALCGADFVHPVEWRERDADTWWMLLRCGACETWREVTVANAAAEAYDAALDRQAASLRALARRLDRECMAMQVEAMIIALRCGLIDAADFAG